MEIKDLYATAKQLFDSRTSYMTLCQEIAENFYPERADFTLRRDIGDEWAGQLMSSYPVLTRRDLGDQIGTMLRPTAKQWFHIEPEDEERQNNEAERWLERAADIQRRAMYDRNSRFTRAVKEGDHDFAAFGQNIISVRMNKHANGLLYRCWHIRDVVWKENEDGDIALIARKWKPFARDLIRLFPATHDPKVSEIARKTPFEEIECMHIICEADMYDGDARGRPYWSIYYDCKHEHLMEAVPVFNKEYNIPRWQTVSGSQYAYSPATIVGLPDARLIQAMTYTLLEAGEKAVNPPMVATKSAVRSDVSIYAGGITWVDMDYDERLGQALRPLTQDKSGLPFGIEMTQDSKIMIAQAFFLNKLTLPQRAPEMTAYEVGQRIQEYIRGALPIFEPMEMEYNGGLCDLTFDILMRAGAFGSPYDMPESLQGANVQFRFESPLHDAIEQQKGQKLLEVESLLAQAMSLDPTVDAVVDIKTAFRDALDGIGTPAEWMNDEITTEQIIQQKMAAQQQAQKLAEMEQGSQIVQNLSNAKQAVSQ